MHEFFFEHEELKRMASKNKMAKNYFRLPFRVDTHRRLVKIYGLEYLKRKTALEQYQIFIADSNDNGFEYEVKKGDKTEYRRDYPYLTKV